MRLLPLLFALLLLSACGQVVATTAARLAALNPLAVDPADIAVTMELPSGVDIAEADVTLSVQSTRRDGVGLDETWHLVRTPQGVPRHRFALAEADWPEVRAAQAKAAAWEAEDPRGHSGSLSAFATARFCLAPGAERPRDPRVSVFVQFKQGGRLNPLVRSARLEDLHPDLWTDEGAALRECD